MFIKSKNFELKIEEILKDDLDKNIFNAFEYAVLSKVKLWLSSAKSFIHNTSGSTGEAKAIEIPRSKIIISANATFDFIDPVRETSSSLLCLNPDFIGGAMVIYRALIFNHNLYIASPENLTLGSFLPEQIDVVSLAPLQFQNLSISDINRFKTILIGGAPISVQENKSTANVFSTFGMTETVSHIALRKLDQELFRTTGDVKVSVDKEGSLSIKGSITDNNWLQTNDLVDLIDETSFRWIGRTDFIINSGGVKINPEKVEAVIANQMDGDFMITSLPDERLGSKVVLLCSESKKSISFTDLPKYSQPKEVLFNQTILKTPSGKVDRLKTRQSLIKQLEK